MTARAHAAFGWTAGFARSDTTRASACWRLRNLVDILLTWRELAHQRRVLLELDDRMLKDIGISRTDAVREASKPFWCL